MEKIAYLVFTISLSYIFTFPMFLVIIKFVFPKKLNLRGEKIARSMLLFVTLAIFNFARLMLTHGEIAIYFILFWFFVLIPTAIGFFTFINGFSNQFEKEEYTVKRRLIFGFKYKTIILLSLSIVLAFSLVIVFDTRSCNTVIDYHNKLVNEIKSSENPKEFLYEEASQPSYMLDDIIADIEQIKDSEAHIGYVIPWRIEIIVQTPDKSRTWVIDYVRNNEKWRLEGLLSKTIIHN